MAGLDPFVVKSRTCRGFGFALLFHSFMTDGKQKCIFGKLGKRIQQVLLQWHFILFYLFLLHLKLGIVRDVFPALGMETPDSQVGISNV